MNQNAIAVYRSALTEQDFEHWLRQRDNILTLICLVRESIVAAGALVAFIIGLAKGLASRSRIIAGFLLVLLCLAAIIYWRFAYPKTAAPRLFQKAQQAQEQNGEPVTTFYEDLFQTKAGEQILATVLYRDIKSSTCKQGLLILGADKGVCYVFRTDGFSEETQKELTKIIQGGNTNDND